MKTNFDVKVGERGSERVDWELGAGHGEGPVAQAVLDEVDNRQRPLPPEPRLPRPKVHRPGGLSKEFREFALRGNVLDMAFGLMLGVAFGKIVTSLVNDVLLPPVGQLLGGVNFTDLFLVLDRSRGEFASLAKVREAGIPVIAYGQGISAVLDFVIIAMCALVMIKWVNTARRQHGAVTLPPATIKSCPYCCSAIPMRATRCPYCTSLVK